LVFLIALLVGRPAWAGGLYIIANPNMKVSGEVSSRELAAIYLLRLVTWPDGTHLVPVNRELGSEIRKKFTEEVLGVDTRALATYWNQMHFQGKQPPLIQESQRAMIAFVKSVPGAIGYVSSNNPPAGVKVLRYVPDR